MQRALLPDRNAMTDWLEHLEAPDASCTLFLNAPAWRGKTAAVGRFTCKDANSGAAILGEVVARAAALGFASILGPMDGDTWHSYRLVVEPGDRPPYFLEPFTPEHFRDAFERAGFVPIASYASATDETVSANRRPRELPGVEVRSWRPDQTIRELERIRALSLQAFSNNPFFSPITLQRFLELYEPLLPLIDPELVLLAEDRRSSDLVGFLFALLDRLDDRRPPQIVLKTYAATRKGAGGLLVDRLYDHAKARGCPGVIHALFHEGNTSRLHSRNRGGQIFRRYALMGRMLTP